MTNPTLKRAAIGVSLLVLTSVANAKDCSQDEAMKMYAKVTDHAAALKADAKANPSKIPFQKGKNDPRVKKSNKISATATSINNSALDAGEYGTACEQLSTLAGQYKIDLGDGVAKTSNKDKFRKGLRAAGQAQSIKNQVD